MGKNILKGLSFLFVIIFLIGIVSARLGTFDPCSNVEIKTILTNTTSVNISTIAYPNSSIAVSNVIMSQIGNTFIYNFNDTCNLGIYTYDYIDNNGNTYENDFKIGKDLAIGEALIYCISFLGELVLTGFCFFFAVRIPYKNIRSEETGRVINVNKLKYIKLGLILLMYPLLTWMFNMFIGLNNFLGMTLFYGFFSGMFNLFIDLTWPFTIFWGILFFVTLGRDVSITRILRRGGHPR